MVAYLGAGCSRVQVDKRATEALASLPVLPQKGGRKGRSLTLLDFPSPPRERHPRSLATLDWTPPHRGWRMGQVTQEGVPMSSRLCHFHVPLVMAPSQAEESLAALEIAITMFRKHLPLLHRFPDSSERTGALSRAFRASSEHEGSQQGLRDAVFPLLAAGVNAWERAGDPKSDRVPFYDLGLSNSGTGIAFHENGPGARPYDAAAAVLALSSHYSLDPIVFEWGEEEAGSGFPTGSGAMRIRDGADIEIFLTSDCVRDHPPEPTQATAVHSGVRPLAAPGFGS